MKLSVCIPTYNRPELIRSALDSVLLQDRNDFEIVICDNSENTLTEGVVKQFPKQRIRYYRHEKNIGIAANWNALLNISKGKYLKFLNDDDELLPGCITDILAAIEKVESVSGRDVGVVVCAAEYVDVNGGIIKRDRAGTKLGFKNFFVDEKNIAELWCYDQIPLRTPTHMVYHRDTALAVGGFSASLDYTRDVHLALQLASQKGAIILDSKPLVQFRLHGGQDVKGISIKTRINDLICTKKWAIDHADACDVDEAAIYGEVCLREMFLMFKARQLQEAVIAFKLFIKKGNLKSLWFFINNNIYPLRNFSSKYVSFDEQS